MADYDWCGFGLTLTFDNGTVWLQGEEASELYDELEACETEEQQQLLLGEYSVCVEVDE